MEDFLAKNFSGRPLSEDDVINMTSAWPMLESLYLPVGLEGQHPTVASLHHLAQLCPKLRYLTMSLDKQEKPGHPSTT